MSAQAPYQPSKWDQSREEDKVGSEGTYLKVMVKSSVLVWNNGKSQSTTLHYPICALPETSINQGQGGLTKFYRIFTEFSKESDRVHACTEVAALHQREDWANQPHGAVVTDTEDSNSENEDSMIPPLIYPEDSDNKEDDPHEYPSNLQAKVLPRNRPRNSILMPYQNLTRPRGRVPLGSYLQKT